MYPPGTTGQGPSAQCSSFQYPLSPGQAAPARWEEAFLSQSTVKMTRVPELSFPSLPPQCSAARLHPSICLYEQQHERCWDLYQGLLFLVSGNRNLSKPSDLSQPQFHICEMDMPPAQMTSQSLCEERMRRKNALKTGMCYIKALLVETGPNL